jgi:hypothetical protein
VTSHGSELGRKRENLKRGEGITKCRKVGQRSRYERMLSPLHSMGLFPISNHKIMDGNLPTPCRSVFPLYLLFIALLINPLPRWILQHSPCEGQLQQIGYGNNFANFFVPMCILTNFLAINLFKKWTEIKNQRTGLGQTY